MTVTPSLSGKLQLHSRLKSYSIEQVVRSAVELGELSPGAEAQVQRLMLSREMTVRDRSLVRLLHDAIEEGCVQRVGRAEGCKREL
jgi:hypothetical protein